MWRSYLVKTCVLGVIRCDFFFSFDFHRDMKTNGTGHGRFIRSFLKIIPNIHLSRQRSNFDDRLTEEIIGLASQLLHQLRSNVIIFIPRIELSRSILSREKEKETHQTRTLIRSHELWHSLNRETKRQRDESVGERWKVDWQEELFAPCWIQFRIDGLRSFLHFADLNGDVRIGCARLVFRD